MSQPPDLICLSDLPHDTRAQLADIRGGRHLTRRLLALGLRQGSLLSVVQRRGQGLVLASGEVRIAVGMGIAEKLWVRRMPAEAAVGALPTGAAERTDTGREEETLQAVATP